MAIRHCWNGMICILLLMAVFESNGLVRAIQNVFSSPPQENTQLYRGIDLPQQARELCMNIFNPITRSSCRDTMMDLFYAYGFYETHSIVTCVGIKDNVTVQDISDIIWFFHNYWPPEEKRLFVAVLAEARYGRLQGIWKVLNFADYGYWIKLLGNRHFVKTFDTFKEILYISDCPEYKKDILNYLQIWTEKSNEIDKNGDCRFGCKFPNVEMIIWFMKERRETTNEAFKKMYETVCYIERGWNWTDHISYLYETLNSHEMLQAPLEVVTSILGRPHMINAISSVKRDRCKEKGWTVRALVLEVLKCHTEYRSNNNECYDGALDAVDYACNVLEPALFKSIVVQCTNKGCQIPTMLRVIAAIGDSYFKILYAPTRNFVPVTELHWAAYIYYINAVTKTGKKDPTDTDRVFTAAYYGKWTLAKTATFFRELDESKFPINLVYPFFSIFYENESSMAFEEVMGALKISKAIQHNLPFEKIRKNQIFLRWKEISALLELPSAKRGFQYYFNQNDIITCYADIFSSIFQYDDKVTGGKLTKENYENLFKLSCKTVIIPENNFNLWVYNSAIQSKWDVQVLIKRLETREGVMNFW